MEQNDLPNDVLRRELMAMATEDLRLREQLAATGELFEGYHPRMEALHKLNAARLREIIDQHGWPGKRLVGEDGASAAWLILQHDIGEPDFLRSALPLLQESAGKGDVLPSELAKLVDRIRVYEGKPQTYGTNFDWDDSGLLSPTQIEDPKNVEALRKSVGLPPLQAETERQRQQAKKFNEAPPQDLAGRQRKAEEWYRAAGWRK